MNKEVIYIRIDEDLKKELDMIALEEQRSLNNLVVYVLGKYLDSYKANKKIDSKEKQLLEIK